MTKEEKELLLRDLCCRLPYGVQCRYEAIVPMFGNVTNIGTLRDIRDGGKLFVVEGHSCLSGDIKPYLRPMSDMTETERQEIKALSGCSDVYYNTDLVWNDNDTSLSLDICVLNNVITYLDKHFLDYRRLIEKGLALKAPENMYN